ncbi:MAG TPA: alpha-amylase family glycosyl hydrolase, partial [Thermodesulfobacteriota bacterium]|nr:alpha-amylase family glycosyl hydrolase [Thermodesulfobacteriota bacterium]
LFRAVEMWIREFDLDGLRVDAADCMDREFLKELSGFCRRRRSDFWLMGEVVHGDYRKWANPEILDSVTNYVAYKSLYSSHLDKNYFELAYTLKHQFGDGGSYRNLPLYAFADNHDVNRVASGLRNPAHLYPLYTLLFTMPGVPSIYYGSEWGIEGKRTSTDDGALRPCLNLGEISRHSPHPDLPGVIGHLARIRQRSEALRYGDYRQLLVRHEQFAFARQTREGGVIVTVNAADKPAQFELVLPAKCDHLLDLLNEGDIFSVDGGKTCLCVGPCWSRILKAIL